MSVFFGNERESRILLLIAGPGFGKSVFAAKVCEDYKKKEKLAACHFCDFNDSNLRNPMMMLQSLASQMCENVVGFKEKLLDQLKRPHEVQSVKDAFGIYLQNPLDELEMEEPSLVVIDGLDESAADNKHEIVNLIADYFPDLPEYIKVLVTSRPTISLAKLSDLEKIEEIHLTKDDLTNNLDLERYILASLPNIANKYKSRLISWPNLVCKNLVQKCEGSFLYAYHVQSELRKRSDLNTMTCEKIIEFLPRGLDSFYEIYFQRLEDELKAIVHEELDLLKVLEMVVASKGPLPLSFVTNALGLPPASQQTQNVISKVNEAVSSVLHVSDGLVIVFHKSVIDWLAARGYGNHKYTVKVSDGNISLWLICEQIFKEIKKNVCSGDELNLTSGEEYALGHGFKHLIACNMKESFFWFVDVVIIHVIFTIFSPSSEDHMIVMSISDIWFKILEGAVEISDELRAQISWNLIEINFLPNYVPGRRVPLLWDSHFYYLQSVLTHSPKGYLSDNDKKKVDSLLSSVPKFVELNFHEVEVIPLGVRRVPFTSEISAVGVSHDKTMAAVAEKNGRVLVMCVENLVKLWQYSTECESIPCCTFAPGDSFVLFGKLETALSLAERKEVPFFHRNKETFVSCAFSPQGKRLITCDGSNAIKLWDIAKQSVLSVLCGGSPINSCFFNSTGMFIIGDWRLGVGNLKIEDCQSLASSPIQKWESDADVSVVGSWDSDCSDRNSYTSRNRFSFSRSRGRLRSLSASKSRLASSSALEDRLSSSSSSEDRSPSPRALEDHSLSSIASGDCLEDLEFYAKNSFCFWNAVTLQRSDDRTLPELNVKERICKRCFRPGFGKLSSSEIEACMLSKCSCIRYNSWFTGIYNGMQCIFALGEHSLSVIEKVHFTTLAAWNLFVPYTFFRRMSNEKITIIKDNMWLYADMEKLIVLRTLAPTQEQYSSLAQATRVVWSSFCPNGSRLATCTSDGFINIWNVDSKQIEQRFKSHQGGSPFAVSWSKEFLFVLFGFCDRISSLSKYLVDVHLNILVSQTQQVSLCHLVNEVVCLSAVVDFTEGFLIFKCWETMSVKLLNVNGVEELWMVTLPESKPMMNVTVSPGACCVFGEWRGTDCYIWKKNPEAAGVYEVFYTNVCTDFSHKYKCCFSSDSKVAVVFSKEIRGRFIFEIVDLDLGGHKIVSFDHSNMHSKLFCLHKDRIVIAASRQFIQFFDMDSGALLESSFQRYLMRDIVTQGKLSPDDATLAFPKINGDMEFLRLCIPQDSLLSRIKQKAAADWDDFRKEFDL